jgi:hypothetical protein
LSPSLGRNFLSVAPDDDDDDDDHSSGGWCPWSDGCDEATAVVLNIAGRRRVVASLVDLDDRRVSSAARPVTAVKVAL